MKKKKIRKIGAVLAVVAVGFVLLALPAAAEDGAAEEYVDEFRELLPAEEGDLADAAALSERLGVKRIFADLLAAFSGERDALVSFFLFLLGAGTLSALLSALCRGSGKNEVSSAAESALSCVFSLAVFRQISALTSEITESLRGICSFFSAVIPIAAGLTAAGGGEGTAAAQATGMSLSLGAVGRISETFLLPLCSLLFALSLISSLGGQEIAPLAKGVRSLFLWFLGITTTVFLASVSLQTLITSAADSAAMRAAKFAAQGLIPMVGGTVSGALGTLGSGIALAKNTVGVGAIAAILSLAAAPLIRLIGLRAALDLSDVIFSFFDTGGVFSAAKSVKGALDCLTAVYVVTLLVYAVQLLLFIFSGVAVT